MTFPVKKEIFRFSFPLLVLMFFWAFRLHGQVIQKDSVVLASIPVIEVSKIVSATDGHNMICVGWQAKESDSVRVYVQPFTTRGVPLSEKRKITSMPISTLYTCDFDVSMDSVGNYVVAWSYYAGDYKYDIFCQYFSWDGSVQGQKRKLGNSVRQFVKTSMNKQGEYLVAYYEPGNQLLNIQLFDSSQHEYGDVIKHYFPPSITDRHVFPVELSDSTQIAIGWLEMPISAELAVLNKQGTLISYPLGSNAYCCMGTFDMDYHEEHTVLGYSLQSDVNNSMASIEKKGTYIAMVSRYNRNQLRNILKIDDLSSPIMQVAQNDGGSIFTAWKTNTGVLKGGYYSNSLQPREAPLILHDGGYWSGVTSFDVLLNNSNDASIVTAHKELGESKIVLRNFHFQVPHEIPEMIVNQDVRGKAIAEQALSSDKFHVALLQYEATDGNAIFAQIYDSSFHKIGDMINVTGYKTSGRIITQAAIDSAGNFFVVWQENLQSAIYAKKYAPDGAVIVDAFQVNSTAIAHCSYPRIASNRKGDFIFTWIDNQPNKIVTARRIKADGSDSGPVSITPPCCSIPGSSYVISMNNAGKFAYIYQSGYYDFKLRIYDNNLQFVAENATYGVLDTDTRIDMALSDQGQIVVAWTRYNVTYGNVVEMRRISEDGQNISSIERVDFYVDALRLPDVVIRPDGAFSIFFRKNHYNEGTPCFIQRFTASGQLKGGIERVCTFNPIAFAASVSQNSNNDFFFLWTSSSYIPSSYSGNRFDVIAKGIYGNSIEDANARQSQTIYFPAFASTSFSGNPLNLSAITSSGLPIHYISSDTTVAKITENVITLRKAGQVMIVATQDGNNFYHPARSVSRQLTVNKGSQTISFDELTIKALEDEIFPLAANATSGLPVIFTSSNHIVATVSGNVLNFTGVGTTTITATQPGNENYLAAPTVVRTLTVKRHQKISLAPIPNKVYGDPSFTLTASSDAALGLTLTSSDVSVATISGNIVTIAGAGSTVIEAQQPGNAEYFPAAISVTLTVSKAHQQITFEQILSKNRGDSPVTLKARASSNLTIRFSSSDSSVAAISGNILIILGSGSTQITAKQDGNRNYFPVTMSQLLVVKKNQVISFNPITAKLIDSAPFDPGATVSSGLPIIYASNNLQVAKISENKIMIVGVGTADITASQNGDEEYSSAVPVTRTLQVVTITSVKANGEHLENIAILYPNPCHDKLIIQLPSDKGKVKAVKIYASDGRLMRDEYTAEKMLEFDVSDFKPGQYVAAITDASNSFVLKFNVRD